MQLDNDNTVYNHTIKKNHRQDINKMRCSTMHIFHGHNIALSPTFERRRSNFFLKYIDNNVSLHPGIIMYVFGFHVLQLLQLRIQLSFSVVLTKAPPTSLIVHETQTSPIINKFKKMNWKVY